MVYADTAVGFIYDTGAVGADTSEFGKLTTIDAPRRGDIIGSCIGRQGLYFLTQELRYGRYNYYVHVLPTPGGTTDNKYESVSKQNYVWRSKEYVMPGITTWAAAKVVFSDGCVRLRLYIDGKLECDLPVNSCSPFRLPSQLAGIKAEIELVGNAQVTEVHIASSMRELLENG